MLRKRLGDGDRALVTRPAAYGTASRTSPSLTVLLYIGEFCLVSHTILDLLPITRRLLELFNEQRCSTWHHIYFSDTILDRQFACYF